MKHQLTKSIGALLVAGLFVFPGLVQAQPTAHYAPGLEGLNAASLPPPGIYLKDYNWFYYADQYNDASGTKVGAANAKAFIYAQVPRLIWITDLQLLGGNIGLDALVPLQYTDLKVGGFDDHTFGMGDPFLEATWSRHEKQFDFAAGFGVFFPTENFNARNPTWAGLGYYTYMFTAGATWYIDQDKKWSVSALNRYEINSQQDDTGISPGQAYTVEGGIGYGLSKTLNVGAIAYYQQQVTKDCGSGASSDCDRVAGVGPEVNVFFPSATLGLSFRYAYEFMAESRLQGHTFTLTLTKVF